ncbi:PIN domain-containing protein [Candidatus Micrarchaeota archaeon]|nr:PIN domain-containing protein [Candidatus Micrarchaeota archaeon]MBU1930909.1 PIN domain-containing protein [Candidatus Micrarchaeota archaeon]
MWFFADTYALVEFFMGNPRYKKYFNEHDFITTRLNLLELYYSKLTEGQPEQAEQYFNSLLPKTIEIEDEILKNAAKFKLQHKKQKVSYVDAIGYELAKSKKIKFLTGDKEFEKIANVEFVK